MPQPGDLTRIVLHWEELQEQLQSISPEVLCREKPELLPEVRRRIEALRQMDQSLIGAQGTPVTGNPAPVPTGIVQESSPEATTDFHPGTDPGSSPSPESKQQANVETTDDISRTAEDTEVPAPREIAGYQILGELGRGGMGVVYKAKQLGLNRIVALKMILHADHAGSEERDRFTREAEAIAKLQHPNIVQIHEIGEHEGNPFFSLELIRGGSLADKLDGIPLTPKEAAQLIELLARGMHVAHQNDIIHRDLKPANVLMTENGTPKISDFGLAKKLDEASQTATGAVVGTPSYMAPEQASGSLNTIGPAVDVYALGAILYECLTGHPPFCAQNVMDTLLQVIGTEPVAPSRLQPKLPKDLETICLKCLEKLPQKRYATAEDLAEDLLRYCSDKPIQARRTPIAVRVLKWIKRNRLAASFLSATALVLVIGTIISTAFAVRANAHANSETVARKKAQELARDEQAARKDADKSFRRALNAVDDLFIEVSENSLLNQPNMKAVRRSLLQRALDYYLDFIAQKAHDPSLQVQRANITFRIALINDQIGSRPEAKSGYEQAITLYRNLQKVSPRDPQLLNGLGDAYNALGILYFRSGSLDSAMDNFEDCRTVRTHLTELAQQGTREAIEAKRKLANVYMNSSFVLKARHRLSEANNHIQKAQDLRATLLRTAPSHPKVFRDFGKGHYSLAQLTLARGNAKDAAKELSASVNVFERLTMSSSSDLDDLKTLGNIYRVQGNLERYHKNNDKAANLYEKARYLLEPMAWLNRDDRQQQIDFAGLCLTVGSLHESEKHPLGALRSYRRAVQAFDLLLRREQASETTNYCREGAITLRSLAKTYRALKEESLAIAALNESERILAWLSEKHEGKVSTQVQLTITRYDLLDSNSDGRIVRDEYIESLLKRTVFPDPGLVRELGISPHNWVKDVSQAQLHLAFITSDADNNGEISIVEGCRSYNRLSTVYGRQMGKVSGNVPFERAWKSFRDLHDQNKDGKLMTHEAAQQHWKRFLNRYDQNKNDVVEKSEHLRVQ